MKDHFHLWMVTATVALIAGVIVIMFSNYEPAGIALMIIGAVAWNESHYIHLKELIEQKK
jgi:hypothetical protein